MQEILGLLFLVGFAITAIYLVVAKRIDLGAFVALLVFAFAGAFGIANYDFIKRLRWKDVEIETFERRVTTVKQEALDDINKQVRAQKDSIQLLISAANDTRSRLESQTKAVNDLLEKVQTTQREVAQSKRDVEAVRRRADDVRVRIEALNKASSDLALLLTKITWLQIETRNQFGTPLAQKAIEETLKELNRIVAVVIPDPAERTRWVQQLQNTLATEGTR